MDGNHWILFVASDAYCDSSIRVNVNLLASATAINQVATDDITVGTTWETSLQGFIHIVAFVVDSDESFAASGESNLVISIVPPVGYRLTLSNISESGHVVDLSPAVLTDPAISAGIITSNQYHTQLFHKSLI